MDKSNKKLKRELNHRGSEKETINLLEAIINKVKENPEGFEKPTAQKFYDAVCCKDPALQPISALGCGALKNKMRYLRKTFISAEEWKAHTGAGLLEEGNEKSVKEYIAKICPHYSSLEQIFGQRKAVDLPFIYDSYGDIDVSENINFEESSLDCIVVAEGTEEVEVQATEAIKNKLKLTPKQKKSNSALDFLVQCQEKRNEVEEIKLRLQEKMEDRRLNVQEMIEERKLNFQREQLQFEKERHRDEVELKKLKLQNDMEVKKFEIEMKYKNNKILKE